MYMPDKSHFYEYKVKYNSNYWGSQRASGYVFAKSECDAFDKLRKRYGEIDYNDYRNSTIVGYEIKETDFIITEEHNIILMQDIEEGEE